MSKFKSTKLWGFISIILLAVADGLFKLNITSHAWIGIVTAYTIFSGTKAWQNVTAMKNGEK